MDQADRIFSEVFGIDAATVRDLARSKYCVFEPLHLVTIRRKAGNGFTAEFITGIFEHRNARSFLIACGELPCVGPDISFSHIDLANLLDNDNFWNVYANSPLDNNSHIGQTSLLNAFFRGAFNEAIERRKLNPAAHLVGKGRNNSEVNLADPMTLEELYPKNDARWRKREIGREAVDGSQRKRGLWFEMRRLCTSHDTK